MEEIDKEKGTYPLFKKKSLTTHFTFFLNGKQRYKFIVLDHEIVYFVKHETKGKRCYTENEGISISISI
jgi:hypothetical protein